MGEIMGDPSEDVASNTDAVSKAPAVPETKRTSSELSKGVRVALWCLTGLALATTLWATISIFMPDLIGAFAGWNAVATGDDFRAIALVFFPLGATGWFIRKGNYAVAQSIITLVLFASIVFYIGARATNGGQGYELFATISMFVTMASIVYSAISVPRSRANLGRQNVVEPKAPSNASDVGGDRPSPLEEI